jgi:hypothetical protein
MGLRLQREESIMLDFVHNISCLGKLHLLEYGHRQVLPRAIRSILS